MKIGSTASGQFRRSPRFRLFSISIFAWLLPALLAAANGAQPALAQSRIVLGKLPTGATVAFVREAGGWGMDIGGARTPHIIQPEPIGLEINLPAAAEPAGNLQDMAAGYSSVRSAQDGMTAKADIPFGPQITFHVEDRWRIKDGSLWVHRHVLVSGTTEGGFGSKILFSTTPDVNWSDVKFLAPSKLYNDPSFDGMTSPGSPLHYQAKRFSIREMALTAPLFALNFADGHSITVLDPMPKGQTTPEEASAPTDTVMTDARLQFRRARRAAGRRRDRVWLLGAGNGGRFPEHAPGVAVAAARHVAGCAARASDGARRSCAASKPNVQPAWRRRYNPIQDGMVQDYEVAFRFGQKETFPQTTRNAWRWAWSILKPAVNYVDLDYVRRVSIDVLSSHVLTVDGRTGIPYLLDAHTGQFRNRSDARRAAMGFCARNIEIAAEFLMEADREPGTPRSQKLRKQGLDIIATFVRLLPMAPPDGDGFDIFTGKIIPASWSTGQQPLLTINTDMRSLMLAYEREKKKGIGHPEWLAWAKSYADWLLTQQHDDGSFPRAWKPGTATVFNDSPSATYAPVVMFVPLARITGERKYLDAALKAGEFLWRKYGVAGNYQGGAVDASSAQLLTDKEGGMASLDAFMALYETTGQPKWLSRALSAADYTESWIWIWNVPLPGGVPDAHQRWRNGPMVGLQEITANGPGLGAGGDEYLDWAVSLYAKAYKYTGDEHYLEVARILLHNTKAKMATSRDTFDFVGPGWEQEGWTGDPGKWLPWMAANHLNGIDSLQEFDPNLYRELAERRANQR